MQIEPQSYQERQDQGKGFFHWAGAEKTRMNSQSKCMVIKLPLTPVY